MSGQGSQLDLIGKRYGRVLFSLALEASKEKAILKDVESLKEVIDYNRKNWMLVSNMGVKAQDQVHVISYLKQSLKLDAITENFLRVVVAKRRLNCLQGMLTQFINCYKTNHGQVDGTVTTAHPLTKTAITSLAKALDKKLGVNIDLTPQVDSKILGGAIVQVGSLMIDASLGTQLHKLRQSMKG